MISEDFTKFVQKLYGTKNPIPLHTPKFKGNEKKYLIEAPQSHRYLGN